MKYLGQNKPKNIGIWTLVAVFVIIGIVFLVFAAGGGGTPDDQINAIYTNAAMTLTAQGATLQAALTSTSISPTALSPTASLTPLATPTVSTLPPFATATSPVGGGCDNSAYVSDVTIPDGTVMALGQSFTKTWRVVNTGTCAWTASYQIILIGGDGMSGTSTAIGKPVPVGQTADISIPLVAPTKAGDVTGTWRLMNDKSQAFGTILTVVIKVGGSTATYTGTPSTATVPTNTNPGPTVTSSPTVASPTNTTEPTGTPTATPTLP